MLTKNRVRPRRLAQAGGIALGVLMLAFIPLLTYVQEAGRDAKAASTHTTGAAIRKAAVNHTAKKVQPAFSAARAAASIGPLETIVQTLNNCGPSSVAGAGLLAHLPIGSAGGGGAAGG